MNKFILKESIRQIVRESLHDILIEHRLNEEEKKEKQKGTGQTSLGNKKNFVKNLLSQNNKDKYDHAHLAYKLWPSMDKDTARSYFSKCVRGERDFSDEDVTTLFNMLST